MDPLWPITAHTADDGALWLGDCQASALADEFGTPLYVFDEATLRRGARAYRAALAAHYPGTAQAAYASKAYLCTAIAQLFAEEGLDLDVVSGGELHVALRAGFPAQRIHFHGNNKSREELAEALAAGIGRIVVDNFHELEMLTELVAGPRATDHASRITHHAPHIPIWLRLSPGIAAHTHAHIQTGHLDTKFGFPIATGDAERAVAQAMAAPGLALVGLHCHIGSQIYEPESLADAAAVLIAFAAEMRDRHGFTLAELSPGGGWGVPMTDEDPAAPVEPYVAALSAAVTASCERHGLALPHLVLEPGRSLVARAGVALYRVGARKEIRGVRTYVSVDGGMADNIRPALYGAKYCGLRIADCGFDGSQSKIRNPKSEIVTIAGKFCESGDVLIRDIELPRLAAGDLLAIPMAGAYTLAMASNYNLAPRPAVVLVNAGQAQVIQRRERYEDLVARDAALGEGRRGLKPTGSAGQSPLKRTDRGDDAVPTHEDWVARDAVLGHRRWLKPTGSAGQSPLKRTDRGADAVPTALRFTKYHGLGNDYIVLDPADWPEPPDEATIRRICDRHRGVGADGVLWGPTSPLTPLLRGEGRPGFPFPGREGGEGGGFALRLFNPDGGEFEKSGNGLRIFARYLWDRRLPAGPDFDILTPGGPVTAHVLTADGSRIAMDMGTLSFRSTDLGIAGPERAVVDEAVEVDGRGLRIVAATIGNPHCVVFLDAQTPEVQAELGALDEALARRLGPGLERLPLYPGRTNVQLAQVVDRHTLQIEIWERGAGYTLASGTSSCAAAGAAIRTGRCESPVTVRMPGGEMLVEIAADGSVRLTGSVAFACRGEVQV